MDHQYGYTIEGYPNQIFDMVDSHPSYDTYGAVMANPETGKTYYDYYVKPFHDEVTKL
jgi:hypothetical protein